MDTQHTKLWVAENAVSRGKFTAKNKKQKQTNKKTVLTLQESQKVKLTGINRLPTLHQKHMIFCSNWEHFQD